MTAIEYLENILYDFIHPEHMAEFFPHVKKAKAMEKEQHGETWDAALIHVDKRGGVILRALVDFDEYWANKSKLSPPGEHCKEA
jgi:hypothetical protein